MQKAGGANPVHPSVAAAVFGAGNQAAASFFLPRDDTALRCGGGAGARADPNSPHLGNNIMHTSARGAFQFPGLSVALFIARRDKFAPSGRRAHLAALLPAVNVAPYIFATITPRAY